MSFSTLYIGASALTASQRAVETAAHNLANSAVEGYTRQRTDLVTAPPTAGSPGVRGSGMRGSGVQVAGVERMRSSIADLAVRGQADTAGSADARFEVLDAAQSILGPYGSGLPTALTGLWDAFAAVQRNPGDKAARQIAVDAAGQVAGGIRDAADQLAQIRSDSTALLGEQVAQVNALATSVGELNGQIAEALQSGQQPNDLLDKRDLALDKLATLAGATSTLQTDGSTTVAIGGRTVVARGTVTPVTLAADPPPAGLGGTDPVLSVGGTAVSAGGAVGGRVTALRTDLRDVEVRLDSLATSIATTVNTQHAAGYDLTGTAGGNVFTATGARDFGVASTLTQDTIAASGRQVTGGNPLDGENALALAGLRTTAPNSLGAQLTGLAGTLGARAAGAASTADNADARMADLRMQRSAQTDVSADEEMVDLVRFQHAYDAAARVISIADGMLDTLINGMGVGR